MRVVRSLALAVALASLCACTVQVTPTSLFEDRAPTSLDVTALAAPLAGVRLEPLTLSHADSSVSRGLHLIAPNSRTAIVYLGGNKMPIAAAGPTLLPRFATLGADVYWLDYRGQGASDGGPTVANLQSDAGELLSLAAHGRKTVIVHGLSMGSLLAGRLSNDPRVGALVLEGAITSIAQVAATTTPDLVRSFVNVEVDPRLSAFDNLVQVAAFKRPLLLIVGSQDTETPEILSRRLYDAAASGDKVLVVATGKGHGDAMASDEVVDAYRKLVASMR